MIQKVRLLVSASILIVMLVDNVFAQKENKIKAILAASDIKKIEKVDANKEVADILMEEANELYKETLAVKGNTQLDEKERMKKIKQLESQTQKKITEASALYQERNSTKYRLYKTYIEKFWLQFKGNEASFENAKKIEEESNDLYYQAVVSRTEANKIPIGYDKIQKLNLAIESENQAIDRQLTVLGLYYGIDLAEKEAEMVKPAETVQPAVQETAKEQPITAVGEADVPTAETAAAIILTESQLQQQKPAEEPVAAAAESQSPQAQPEVVYRIQVAASKTPLSKENAAKLCSKPYTAGEVEENGWYKYQIVAGNSYEQAKKILRECGAEKAFIIPYKNGRKITISEATQTNP